MRTTNVVESLFATVKQRMKQTGGAGSRDAGLAMALKLLLQAEQRWCQVNSLHLVPLVQTGVKFPGGETKVLPDLPVQTSALEVVNVQNVAAV